MSEKLDQFALNLLVKTRAKKLDWRIHANPYGRDQYYVDLEDGYRFGLWQVASGDSRSVTLRLEVGGHPALETTASNWPGIIGGASAKDAVARFRLYSDLFDAVREGVYGSEETLEKVEQLLKKIG